MNFAALFISHDLAVVDILADRIAVLYHGNLVEEGTGAEVLVDGVSQGTTPLTLEALCGGDREVTVGRRDVGSLLVGLRGRQDGAGAQ